MRTPNALTEAIRQFKKAFIRQHLAAGESVSATAKRLGIQRTYLVRLKRDLGIEGPRDRDRGRRQLLGQP